MVVKTVYKRVALRRRKRHLGIKNQVVDILGVCPVAEPPNKFPAGHYVVEEGPGLEYLLN